MAIQLSHPVLRDFFEQLRFAPTSRKKKQLAAAEQLLLVVDSAMDYPFDFVVFRITGHRPRVTTEQILIAGADLLADLRVWIARISDELELTAAEQQEPLLTVEELATRFSVSAKTIRRWQQRGLHGKIYVFRDGKKRKGFTESTVSQFVAAHPRLIAAAGRFQPLDAADRGQVIDLARRLSAEQAYRTRNRLIGEIAQRTGRARETVRSILNAHELDPAGEKLPISRGKLSPLTAVHLYKLSRQGVSTRELMARFGRSRSSICRIINQQRAREFFGRKVEYIDSDEFARPDADELILATPLERLMPDPKTENILLSRPQETALFRRYNYLKSRAVSERTRIQRGRPRTERLNRIESLLTAADEVKKVIIEANMPLVVSIAGKHLTAGLTMSELVSEGSLALMAAVEKFDYTRGYRFSTYASWAIVKDFARMIPAEAKRLDRAGGADFANLNANLRLGQLPDVYAVEQAQSNLRKIIENNLDERQQYIILNHYAIDTEVIKKKPKTLKEIGDDLDLSKERVRQIELQALQKLRHSLSPEQFDLLTG